MLSKDSFKEKNRANIKLQSVTRLYFHFALADKR